MRRWLRRLIIPRAVHRENPEDASQLDLPPNGGVEPFITALTKKLTECAANSYGADNWDADRFGPYPDIPIEVPEIDRNWLMAEASMAAQSFGTTYSLLRDDASRSTLVSVLAYRLLGPRKVKLPLNTPEYWALRESLGSLNRGDESLKVSFPNLVLGRMALDPIGFHIELYNAPPGVMCTFALKQYEYQRINPVIRPRGGDVVIDAGGCWGDTALYFAHEVGSRGKVFSFEFVPENLEIHRRNLALNPELARRIAVVPRALWDRSGETLRYAALGPGTSLLWNGPADCGGDSAKVTTVSVDDFASEHDLSQIDFIKMDIEGAELTALTGAEKTMRRCKPTLAISVYHRPNDLVDIPDYLNGLHLGYSFYLDHFTTYGEETVLFATPESS